MLFNFVLEKILPGEVVEGVELDDSHSRNKKKIKLKYTMSGIDIYICVL